MGREFWCMVVLGVMLATMSFGSAEAAKRLALVVGNGKYTFSPLKNPPSDAKLIARSLESAGFDVALKLDQDQRGLKRAVRDFGQSLLAAGEDAVGLFYYAGHGIQVGGDNYMIPVQADIRSESDVEIEAVRVGTILNYMGEAGNRLNFVVMDACRNNPFARSMRSAVQGLARMDAPSGTLIAYATSPGKVALDGAGNNSPYSKALAKHIASPGVTVERMFKMVRSDVLDTTGRQQVPWESSSLTGDFFFTPAKPKPVVEPQMVAVAPATPVIDLDLETWRSVATSTDPMVIRTYLAAYPHGKFAAVARAKADAIERRQQQAQQAAAAAAAQAQQQRAAEVESAFWRGVADSNDVAVLQTYLTAYPNGTYAALAVEKIEAAKRAKDLQTQQLASLAASAGRTLPTGTDIRGRWAIHMDYYTSGNNCGIPVIDRDTEINVAERTRGVNHIIGQHAWSPVAGYLNFKHEADKPGTLLVKSLVDWGKRMIRGELLIDQVEEGKTYEIPTNNCIKLKLTFKKKLD